MKKRVLAFFMALTFALSMMASLSVSAQDGVQFWTDPDANKPIEVLLDGKALSFDVPPQLIKGRTMVPLRVIYEALGATVYWDDATQTATAVKGNAIMQMTIGSDMLYCSGQALKLDSPACLIEDRTLVPVRAISEAFGMKVEWNNVTRTVTIDTPAEPVEIEPAEDVFETAHRKLKDFIVQDGEWDVSVPGYWIGYSVQDDRGYQHEFDLLYRASGAFVVYTLTAGTEQIGLVIEINEYNYPIYAMSYANGAGQYIITGIFRELNAPGTEHENTFPLQERAAARQLLNQSFGFMDIFMEEICNMSLAECGLYYEATQQ